MFETDTDDDAPATSRSPASMPLPDISMVVGGHTLPKPLQREWTDATADCDQKIFVEAELRMRYDVAKRALEAARSRRAHICAAVDYWMRQHMPAPVPPHEAPK